MPVKNIKRRTNDGLEGVITGLTEEEKEVLQKSLNIDDMNKVIPTDVAIKDNKLGLEHDSIWLTNQNAINLGSNMKYDAETNTLNTTGGGLNTLSLNLKDCMNESDYNELIDNILQKTVIAKTYNITLPDLTDVDIVKFATETSIGNMSQTFYRNSKAITQFNWLCNWTDDENFIQMVTITGFTDNNVTHIKYNGINDGSIPIVEGTLNEESMEINISEAQTTDFILHIADIESYLYMSVFSGYYGCYLPVESYIYVFSGSETTIKVSMSNSLETIRSTGSPISVKSPGILSIDNTNSYLYSISGGKLATGLYPSLTFPNVYVYYYTDSENKLQSKILSLPPSRVVPLFTKYNVLVSSSSSETEILPCTASDNGKVLSVVNGEAQWASATGGVSVTFED